MAGSGSINIGGVSFMSNQEDNSINVGMSIINNEEENKYNHQLI